MTQVYILAVKKSVKIRDIAPLKIAISLRLQFYNYCNEKHEKQSQTRRFGNITIIQYN